MKHAAENITVTICKRGSIMSIENAQLLSAQEQAILEGKKVLHGTVTDRVLRMFEAIRPAGSPRVALERAVHFTESFKATESQPLVLRWAKALKNIAEKMSVAIFDDELIVGRPCTWFGRYSLVYPELDGTIIQEGAKAFIEAKKAGAPDAVTVTDEDKKIIDEVLFPYWKGKDFTPNFIKALPPETRHLFWGSDPENVGTKFSFVIISTSTMRHSQNWVPDFEKMLKRGCKGLREEAQARLAALEDPRDLAFRRPFYEAAIITCDALSLLAKRYSELAAQMAAKTKDAQRKKELEEIAAVCAWVPENPARTFREAIQAQWFTQLFSRLEEMVGGQVNQGRMDQYLYPTYKKDIEAGRITPEGAQELFQCLWLHIMQSIESQMSPSAAKGREGFSHHETVTIGGQTTDGFDATNELSYLILESTRPLRSSYPELGVRIHANTPDKFLHAVAETIKDGKGSPKLINDEFEVPWFMSNGIVKREALDYAMSGCSESRLPNRETHKTGNGGINYGAVMEMTLRDGKMKIYKDEQFGLKTGDPRTFKTYDDVWNAYRLQLENVVKHIMIQNYIAAGLKSKYIAAPLASTLHDLCMEHGRDLHTHADYIPGALDASCIDGLGGFATCIDSLAAHQAPHLRHEEAHLGPAPRGPGKELGRQGSHAAVVPQRPQVRQRHRVGGHHRLPDPAHRYGVCPPASQAAWPERQHAHHSDHLPQPLRQGDHGHAERPEGRRVSLRRHRSLARLRHQGTHGDPAVHRPGDLPDLQRRIAKTCST